MRLAALLTILSLLGQIEATAEEFRPNLGPELPSITVTAGKVSLLLRRASQ